MDLKKHLLDVIKIVVIILIYVTVLFILAPLVDHAFTSLHKDETNFEIMSEIILQLITVSIVWYYVNSVMIFLISKYINLKGINQIESVISIVSGLMFVGLQTHLKSKLNYITHEHPFRFFQFLDDKDINNENSHSWKDVFG